jgi:hypothetical protein
MASIHPGEKLTPVLAPAEITWVPASAGMTVVVRRAPALVQSTPSAGMTVVVWGAAVEGVTMVILYTH